MTAMSNESGLYNFIYSYVKWKKINEADGDRIFKKSTFSLNNFNIYLYIIFNNNYVSQT